MVLPQMVLPQMVLLSFNECASVCMQKAMEKIKRLLMVVYVRVCTMYAHSLYIHLAYMYAYRLHHISELHVFRT